MADILRIEKLEKSFEGNQIFSDVSFAVSEGELSAIIGPNGAGKTTLFNLITGHLIPDSGKVVFNDRDITGMEPFDIVKLGMARAFQRTNIFPRMSVLDNVVAGVLTCRGHNLNLVKPFTSFRDVRERAFELLESVGLTHLADRQSGTLAHGNQKRLDIAVALALNPRLLLLDEPMAGMSPDERKITVDLIKELWERLKITMVFIEHDMDVVFGISQIVRVLCYKTILAQGTPDEISSNRLVIEAYLGEEV
jgi:branched-chain amino acid transport system ATP-binding protein